MAAAASAASSAASSAAAVAEVRLPLAGGAQRSYSAHQLWELFVRLNPVDVLRQEVTFIESRDRWNDYGFSIHQLQELASAVGSASLQSVPLFAIAVVLYRTRTIEWGWYHQGRVSPGNVLMRAAPPFTDGDRADVLKLTMEIFLKANIPSPFGDKLTMSDHLSSAPSAAALVSEEAFHISSQSGGVSPRFDTHVWYGTSRSAC
jgi:hypothetical protein